MQCAVSSRILLKAKNPEEKEMLPHNLKKIKCLNKAKDETAQTVKRSDN